LDCQFTSTLVPTASGGLTADAALPPLPGGPPMFSQSHMYCLILSPASLCSITDGIVISSA